MKCSETKFDLAFYADGNLSETAAASVREHLQVCPLCRQSYAETVEMQNALRRMRRPEIPAGLARSIKDAAITERRRSQSAWFSFPTDVREWIEMRLMPYGVGVLASLVIGFTFLGMLFSKIVVRNERASTGPTTVMLASNSNPYGIEEPSVITPADYARTRLAVAGESPSVNPNGALVALTKTLVRGDMKDDEVVVVADVFGNGLAKIAEVVEPSRDRRAVEELEKALATDPAYAPFVPSTLENRPDSMRVILRFQRVNVSTRLNRRR